MHPALDAAEDTFAYGRCSSTLDGDCVSGPVWEKPESQSNRAVSVHAPRAALVKYFGFVLSFKPSALKGVGNGGCLQRFWHNVSFFSNWNWGKQTEK